MAIIWNLQIFSVFLHRKISTSYHNKAIMAEGLKPILPLRWEFLRCLMCYFSLQ